MPDERPRRRAPLSSFTTMIDADLAVENPVARRDRARKTHVTGLEFLSASERTYGSEAKIVYGPGHG